LYLCALNSQGLSNNLVHNIDKGALPKHIAVTMDGNGRWAKQQGFQRIFGHKNAIKAVRETTEACAELGVGYLTLYTFSNENWNRPKKEVTALMELLKQTIHSETKTLMDNEIKFNTIVIPLAKLTAYPHPAAGWLKIR